MQTVSISRLITGFATILIFAVVGGSVGYAAGVFVSETLAMMLSFAGVMAGLVVGSVYFVKKTYGNNPLVPEEEESIVEANDELFDRDGVFTYDNAADRYVWMPRVEWEKRELDDNPADDDDGD